MKGMFALIALAATPVFAQEVQTSSQKAPTSAEGALEITLGAGYAQGFGDIGGSQRSLTDLNSAGGEVIVGAGYRIDRHLFVGAYGSGGKYSTADLTSGADIWTATAGAQANYHFLPEEQWDPWIGLGIGWRGHWIDKAVGTDTRHGLDLARLQVGVDYRVSPEFSIAPYVGASASLFLAQELAQQTAFSNVQDPNVNLFFFGGVMGRFDILGSRAQGTRVASN